MQRGDKYGHEGKCADLSFDPHSSGFFFFDLPSFLNKESKAFWAL